MSIKFNFTDKAVFITYNTSSLINKEYEENRAEILEAIDKIAIPKNLDVIFKIERKDNLQSHEMGIIALIARELQRVDRKLFLLCSPKIKDLLLDTSMSSIPNLFIDGRK